MAEKAPDKTGRKQAGQFAKGQSGNPAGRPKGSRNKTTTFCADLLSDDAGDIMRSVIDRAKKGNPVALRLCVERLVPARVARDRAVEVDLPAVATVADLVTAAAAVISHAGAGDITLSEAREFMQLLEAQRRVIETSEVVLRLEALEMGQQAETDPAAPSLAARVRRLGFVSEGKDETR